MNIQMTIVKNKRWDNFKQRRAFLVDQYLKLKKKVLISKTVYKNFMVWRCIRNIKMLLKNYEIQKIQNARMRILANRVLRVFKKIIVRKGSIKTNQFNMVRHSFVSTTVLSSQHNYLKASSLIH